MKILILLLAIIFLFSCGEPITMDNVVYSPPGGNNSGGNNPGGNDPGGSNPGGNNPGGNNPGGNAPGGNNPGGNIPGGNDPGGNNPGGNNPGGNNPGVNNPGGSNPPSVNYPGYFENNFDNVFNVHERNNIPTSFYVRTPDLLRVSVLEVIDGDTILVRINNPPEGLFRTEIVRLKGIRAPKLGEWIPPPKCSACLRGVFGQDDCSGNISGWTCSSLVREQLSNWNRFANDAADAINAIINQFGNTVFLAFDQTARNSYGHLLAYAFLDCGVSINAYMLKLGLVRVQSPPNFSFRSEFNNHENFARTHILGGWCYWSPISNPFHQEWP